MKKYTVEELCRKLKPILGKSVDVMYLKYSVADSKEQKKEIERMLNILYEKYLQTSLLSEKILLEPPDKFAVSGEFEVGMINYADKDCHPFYLRRNDLMRHICITGMSGSGKTNLAFILLKQLLKTDVPFIIFDWKKSFRSLLKHDDKILHFTVGNPLISNLFRVNINRPPENISPKIWIGILCDLIAESFSVSYGVHRILQDTLDRAFRDFGVYSGSNRYPTWHHIKRRLEEKARRERLRGRVSEWTESALRVAYVLTFGHFGEVLNADEGEYFDFNDLKEKRVIFELKSLNSIEKKFFCSLVLSYIYFSKKASEEKCNVFKQLIVVDEAHNIFLRERPVFLPESVTDMIYRELREYGVGLMCIDQHISKLSDAAVGNSATHFSFHQLLPEDIEKIANLMQLNDEKKYFSMLPVGWAIVKLAERYTFPFLIKIPKDESKEESVPDYFVKKYMEEKLVEKRASLIFDDEKEHSEHSGEARMEAYVNKKVVFKFLEKLSEKNYSTAKLYLQINVSGRQGNEIKKKLLAWSLIGEEVKKTKKGQKKILFLTPLGRKILNHAKLVHKRKKNVKR
ncbi:hypothetical protein DRJ16_00880 [Candidatus Woesearchaeota archaeon]|nr:MAG: hypothetical protein DRJ16_00880 [Candidatus Woesearchaeota archaeon]